MLNANEERLVKALELLAQSFATIARALEEGTKIGGALDIGGAIDRKFKALNVNVRKVG